MAATTEIALLIEKINSSAQQMLLQPGDDHRKEISSLDERARQSLIQAAEKLVIASRRPHENLYATATNVFDFFSLSPSFSLSLLLLVNQARAESVANLTPMSTNG